MSERAALTLFSCVGGGPMQRLVEQIEARGRNAALVEQYGPTRWRQLMSGGRLGRLRARVGSMARFPARALRRALGRDAGTLVPTTNPFILPALLVATKALHGRPVIALVYDLFPDAIEWSADINESSWLSRAAAWANKFLVREADAVVFIGDRMGRHIRARYGEPRRHVTIHTGAVSREFEGVDPDTFPLAAELGDKVVASYVGNMGVSHDWETLAAGLAQLSRSSFDNLAVVIAASGAGVEQLRGQLPPGSERFVHFLAPLEDFEWRALLARTDVALVSLRDEARHTSVPSKVFSAMAAGAAILAVAPRESDLGDVVIASDCGAVVQPGNALHLFDAISRMVREPSELARLQRNAAVAARDRYDISVLAERWEAVLAEAEADPRAGVGYEVLKRAVDVGAAAGGLMVLAPLIAAVGAAIRLTMGSPVVFRQLRPGHGGRPFELIKFRSMRDARPDEQGAESDARRITRLGRFLRASSLDELPTLINVLRGEMSLVGPRPLMMQYLDRYNEREARRHDVIPGVTGRAQVRGRNAISWQEKFEHDLWYVSNRSLWVDLQILIETFAAVFRRDGISQEGHATMPEFQGTAVSG